MKKRILELCLSPDLGGLELSVVDFYKAFKKETESFICVADGKKLDTFLADNPQKLTLKRSKVALLLNARRVAKYLDANAIDIIHFHWTKDMPLAVLAKTFASRNVKIVQSRHMTMTRFKSDFYHRWLYKNIDMMHAVTKQVKAQIQKYVPRDIIPVVKDIYLGVDEVSVDTTLLAQLKKEYNIGSDDFVVGIVGRIEEGKGQYIVIEALKKLQNLNIKLLIVGHTMDEAYLHELQEKVNTLGVSKQVIFTGFTKEVNAHMQLFDVAVLATPKETFGLVVIEAMINKVVVIATNQGGPLEIIEDGVDGLLFDRSAQMLAQKIEQLYNDKAYKEKLSAAAYKTAKEKFDKETQMKKLYKAIVDED